MDNLFLLVLVFMCVAPIVVLGGSVVVVINGMVSRRALEARTAELETALHDLRYQNQAMWHRIQRLETATAQARAAPTSIAAAGPGAPSSVVSAIAEPVAPVAQAAPPVAQAAPPTAALHESAPAELAGHAAAPAEVSPSVAGPAHVAVQVGASVAASVSPDVTAPAPPPPSSASASPHAPAPPTAPAPPGPPDPSSDAPPDGGGWEQLLGVRGAAAAGAVVLVIAGLFFFQHAIEHGWIGPTLRVAIGTLVGLGCVLASEWPLRGRFPALSVWLAGAGIAILYGSFWAMGALYALVPMQLAFALMALVTASCVVLAVRRAALPVAVLGLFGGFATPIALSTGEDRPIPLFAYLFVLDLALLWIARRNGWVLLSWLALVLTLLYEAAWLFLQMDQERLAIGVVVVVLFGALFTLVSARPPRPSEAGETTDPGFDLLPLASAIVPFGLVLAFSTRAGPLPLHATFGMLVLLSAGSMAIAILRDGWPVAATGASGALGVLAIALGRHPQTLADAWELSALIVVVAAVFHAGRELRPLDRGLTGTAIVAGGGGMLLVVLAMLRGLALPPWPELAALAIVAVLVYRQSTQEWCAPALAVPAFIVALAAIVIAHARPGALPLPAALGIAGALIAGLTVPALASRSPTARLIADHASAAAALFVLFSLGALPALGRGEPWAILGSLCIFSILALLSGARTGMGGWSIAGGAVLALVVTLRALQLPRAADASLDLVVVSACAAVLTGWPVIAGPRLREDPWSWRGAAIAGPLLFVALRELYLRTFGPSTIGLLGVALAVLALTALAGAQRFGPRDPAGRKVAVVWLAAAASAFVTIAIPLQLRNEWITIGWALEAAALMVLYRRIDHAGIKWAAAALFAVVCARLLLVPLVLDYYPRGEWRIVNWLAYTYLVPALALLGGSLVLRPIEVERFGDLERSFFQSITRPFAALSATLFGACLLLVFVWLNLTIIDFFAEGRMLSIPTSQLPARDLAISIAWAGYAFVLLLIGMFAESTALRAVSLVLLIVTCGKVFLYDLAYLRDLYRVAALVGLAISLIAVSLVYQRFVFRRPKEAA